MPETIDWPRPRAPRRWRSLLLIIFVLFVVLGSRTALSFYVDALWFGTLGYGEVFWTTLHIQSACFVGFFAATFLPLYALFLGLKKLQLPELQTQRIEIGEHTLELPVDSALRGIGTVVLLVLSAAIAAGIMTDWPALALYWHAARDAGVTDPVFGRPLSFYLFTLPVWQLVVGWLMSLAVIACAMAGLFALLGSGRMVIAGRRGRAIVSSQWRGPSLCVALLFLTMAMREYLARFDLLVEPHTVFTGIGFTEAHVLLPGMLAIALCLVIGAVIALVNALSEDAGVRRLIASIVPAGLCFVVVQLVAWYVGNFVVKPNELVREGPYIAHNIQFTQQAYGLDSIQRREFPAETTVAALDASANRATLDNIRLWDWRALQDTLRQIQEIRTYYDFPDIDIDRYNIGGTTRQVMLGTRELNVEKLPESSRNWINEKLIYTHGYGVTMNPVNGFTPEGLPTLLLSNMPVQSDAPGISVTRPEVYFGELTNTDVYVKTRQKEFNYPQGDTNNLNAYEGAAGIPIGGFFRRLLLAADRSDLAKLPFSDDVTSDSRLLMRRNVRERVETLAPFLVYDADPYIVVGDDGRLSWMMDAFTTSENYPYATPNRLEGYSLNYVRNSVKVVVDAYDGSVSFYVFDEHDPIIAAWRRVFPGMFKDAAQMPPGLRKHVRYPELLLKLQAAVYGLYHMADPEVFYNREDLWTVASEVGMNAAGEQATQPVEPNFVLMQLPGESGTEFVEILPFTPANRNNLIGWIAGRSDGAHYGTSLVYDFPKTRLVDGPLQIEARIDQNAQLSGQLTLWNQQGSHARRGALLVIPCGRALLYAEPIYLQAERSPMPELRLVVLALQDRLAYGPTFEAAMASLFGGATSSTSAPPNAPQESSRPATQPGAAPSTDLNALISEAAKDLGDYQRLTAEGKLAEAGQRLQELKRVLDELNSRAK